MKENLCMHIDLNHVDNYYDIKVSYLNSRCIIPVMEINASKDKITHKMLDLDNNVVINKEAFKAATTFVLDELKNIFDNYSDSSDIEYLIERIASATKCSKLVGFLTDTQPFHKMLTTPQLGFYRADDNRINVEFVHRIHNIDYKMFDATITRDKETGKYKCTTKINYELPENMKASDLSIDYITKKFKSAITSLKPENDIITHLSTFIHWLDYDMYKLEVQLPNEYVLDYSIATYDSGINIAKIEFYLKSSALRVYIYSITVTIDHNCSIKYVHELSTKNILQPHDFAVQIDINNTIMSIYNHITKLCARGDIVDLKNVIATYTKNAVYTLK